MNIFKRAIYSGFSILAREVCRREILNQKSAVINEQLGGYRFTLQCICEVHGQTILDVGTGPSAFPALLQTNGCAVTAIDEMTSYWKNSIFPNRHFYVIKDDITNPKFSGTFDVVTCTNTIQHIPNHLDAVREMFNFLRPGGFLILTFVYNEKKYVKNVYELPNAGYGQNYPFICQIFSRQEIDLWLADNPGKILKQEYFEMFNGEFWTFEGRCQPRKVTVTDRHHYTHILIQKNVDDKDKIHRTEEDFA